MPKRFVSKKMAPSSSPLSTAVIAGDNVYFSGMLSVDPATGDLMPGTAFEETDRIINNLKTMLGEMGRGLESIVMMQCFISSMEHNDGFADAYAAHFASLDCPPARRTIVAVELWGGSKVEISCIAYLGDE
ncbi:reactive intermediate/imine deaminase [Deltaproteobacteria bacterium Smac51]|nr:reactive intermediate/imine deaminase [Deltaproteobacteria bacterium Smac51]